MTSLPAPVTDALAAALNVHMDSLPQAELDDMARELAEDDAGLYHGPSSEALHGAVERAGEREAVREAAG